MPITATMRAVLTRVSWSLVVFGVLGLALAALRQDDLARSLYFLSGLGALVSVFVGARLNGLKSRVPLAMLAVMASYTLGEVCAALYPSGSEFGALGPFFYALGQFLLASALLAVIRVRSGRNPAAVLADASIVGIGAWLVCWIVLIKPTIEGIEAPTGEVVLTSLYQPMSIVILFLMVTIALTDTFITTSIWMFVGALGGLFIGDLIFLMGMAGYIPDTETAGLPLYVLAYALMAASFFHPTIATLLEPLPVGLKASKRRRLVLTAASVVVPVTVLALTDSTSTADRVIRATGAALLTIGLSIRVGLAVRQSAQAESLLLRSAHTDPLTGLGNRALVLESITMAMHDARRSNRTPAVLFIDVDRFKNINDSLGHAAGDEVLMTVAHRIEAAVPSTASVSRIAGDEFVVLAPDVRTEGEAVLLAERILEVFDEPLPLRAGDIFVTASIGLALAFADRDLSADDLLRHADTAMYRAKDAGRSCVAVFDESMVEQVSHRLTMESALFRALERQELRLFHQPIIDVVHGEIIGFEALMRWDRNDGSLVSPAEFIPIAEETGIIVPIGAWALLDALGQLATWYEDGTCPRHATMSVNVSPRQLNDPNFVSIVTEALTRSGVPASQLWLEVTESVMISQPEQALDTLQRVRALGVRIAVDDFGTGYSSLSLLQKFPIQRIKIDRSFVSEVVDDPSARGLVRAMIAMSRSMGLDTVAEGVETQAQLQALADLGCAKAQGFLISRPIPPEAMASLVSTLQRSDHSNGSRPRL